MPFRSDIVLIIFVLLTYRLSIAQEPSESPNGTNDRAGGINVPKGTNAATSIRNDAPQISKSEAAVAAVTSTLSTAKKISQTLSQISGMAAERSNPTYSRSVVTPQQHESGMVGKFCFSDADCDPNEECLRGLPQMGISPLSNIGMPGGRAFEGIAKQVVKAPFSDTMMCAPRMRPSAASIAAKRTEELRMEEGLKNELQAVLFKHKPIVICNNPTVVQRVGGIPRALDIHGDYNDLFNVTIPTGDSLFVKVSTLFPKKQTVAGTYIFDCTVEGTFYEKFAVEVFDGFNSFQVAVNVCLAQFDCIPNLALINFDGNITTLDAFNQGHTIHDAVEDDYYGSYGTRTGTPGLPALDNFAEVDAALRRYRQQVGIYSVDPETEDLNDQGVQQHQAKVEQLKMQLKQQDQRFEYNPYNALPSDASGSSMNPTASTSVPVFPTPFVPLKPIPGVPPSVFPASAASDLMAVASATFPPAVQCAPTKIIAAKVRDHFQLTEPDLVVVSGGRLSSLTLVLTAGPNKGKQLAVPQEFECDTVAQGRIEFVAIVTGPGGINTALCSQRYDCSQNQAPVISCLPNNRWNVNVGTISSINNNQVFMITDTDDKIENVKFRVADRTGLIMADGVIHFQCPGPGEFDEAYFISAMDGIHSAMRVCEVTYVCLSPQSITGTG